MNFDGHEHCVFSQGRSSNKKSTKENYVLSRAPAGGLHWGREKVIATIFVLEFPFLKKNQEKGMKSYNSKQAAASNF